MSEYTDNTRQTEIHAAVIDTAVKFTEKSMLVIRSAYQNTGIMADEDGVMDIVELWALWYHLMVFCIAEEFSNTRVASVLDLVATLPIEYETLNSFV